MRIGSLFAGIGGFDLAARWMRWETAWYSEIEPYACKTMSKHFPGAINHGDITKIKGADVERIDLLCGGFPCQDISQAQAQSGDGLGLSGPHSGLWGEFARLIGELSPRWVVIENVPALRRRGLRTVLEDLTSLGYDATWTTLAAGSIGAPHKRARLWVVAYPNGSSEPNLSLHAKAQELPQVRSPVREWSNPPRNLGVANGVPYRMDRLRALGNSLTPQAALQIFKAIAEVGDA